MTNLKPVGKCPSANYPIDIKTELLKQHRILLQETQGATIVIGLGRRDVLIKELTKIENLFKGYSENENRDWHGRWALENASAASLASPGEGVLESGLAGIRNAAANNIGRVGSIFGRLSATAAAGLGEFVATFAAGAVAFLGAYIIPFGRSSVASGTLPGYPGLTYHYDGDMGHFSLYNSDNELLFTGTTGGDGLIRTADGDVIGRRIDGSVILDSTIIPVGPKDKTKSSAQPGAQSQSIATTVPPNLCPDPSPDRPGFKSARSIAYQQYISTLINPDHPIPPGWAVNLPIPPRARSFPSMIVIITLATLRTAKGPGISDMVQNEKMAAYLTISYQNQAERQIGAAPGHRIDWMWMNRKLRRSLERYSLALNTQISA